MTSQLGSLESRISRRKTTQYRNKCGMLSMPPHTTECTKGTNVNLLSEQPTAISLLRNHVTHRSVRPEAARAEKD